MKLIILDRDGVINQDRKDYIKSTNEWVAIPRSVDAIAFLNQFGYAVAIATNQSGIAKKLFTINELNEIHSKMHKLIKNAGGEIEGIWFCPHQESDNCLCRKPKTALLEDMLVRLNATPSKTYMVGDSLRDLQCIDAVGGIPVLVLTGNGKKTLCSESIPENTLIYDDLWSFSQDLCLNKN